MTGFSKHLRTAFLSGILAIIPVAATVFIVWYVESKTRLVAETVWGGAVAPFVGVLLAVLLIYLIGVGVSSLVGRWVLLRLDRQLDRMPLVRGVYSAWKQIALTPGGGEGMYSKVVLIDDPEGLPGLHVGFSSGLATHTSPPHYPVFLPQSPNPLNGRLLFVPVDRCTVTSVSAEDAFKMLLSSGNYVPPGLTAAFERIKPLV